MTIRVAYVTTNRSDYGAVYWLLRDLSRDARFSLQLIVGGAHRASGSIDEIKNDGFAVDTLVPFDDDQVKASAVGLTGFADAFREVRPDLVLLYGDRWELLPVANAALLLGIPIAHMCGGDITEGAIDEQVRHAITKIAHVHFATSARSAARIRQMGEEAWRVHDVGDPSIDRFRRGRAADLDELTKFLGFRPDRETLLITFHPPTRSLDSLDDQVHAIYDALRAYTGSIVITAPAPDPGADVIRRELASLARTRPHTVFVESLGSDRYRGLMNLAGAMVGNSSSGLSEAPCVPLPVVNIGDRQAGRDRAANVIDVPPRADDISAAIARALDPAFRVSLSGITSPYGDGESSQRIVATLASLPRRDKLLRKRFVEIAAVTSGPRPIGGDFALDAAWLLAGDTSMFAAARDALAAIVRPRPGRWLVPEYLCPIVPDTLRAAGATVEPYAWLSPWLVDEADLKRRIGGAAGVIVPFHLGLAPAEPIWSLLANSGVCIVEDRAHCVGQPPAPGSLRGDFAIGSLRKWMPVPDGAWCVARSGEPPRPSGGVALDMVRLRAAAGLTRAAWIAGGARDGALERAVVDLFARGEAAAGEARDRSASAYVPRALAELDLAAIFEHRLGNQRALAGRLAAASAVEVWEPSPGLIAQTETPLLALPVLCRDRDALRERLAEQRIFCAVHWVDGDWSGTSSRAADWAARSLSLPIDQRLGAAEISRIAEMMEGHR